MAEKQSYLQNRIEHIDMKSSDVRPMVEAMGLMAFQARNLYRAATIYDMMVKDKDCGVILCLAGSLISAGLKQIVVDLLRNNMVDAIVSTGANIVDQDFFESLGFHHYIGSPQADDHELRKLAIDRIYDTYIDENDLRVCDHTVARIANELKARPYSSREFIHEMGRYIHNHPVNGVVIDGIVHAAFEKQVPIFCPAFSDCSAGFGFVIHQRERLSASQAYVTLDSARDFLELTKVKLACKESGLVMIGGGVPKNFAQDTVVAAELLGEETPMHKYAVQLTVADERDGALSGSTLQEACSWGKVDTTYEQMVYGEATLTFPLLAGYVYHQGHWQQRSERKLNTLFEA